jgi:hypothetical protein
MSTNYKVIFLLLFGVIILGVGIFGWIISDKTTVERTIEENNSHQEIPLDTESPTQADWSTVDNLYAFSKMYGYIKYFHPSDEASQIDWDLFAIYGVQRVLEVKSETELKGILEELFAPLAPTMRIYFDGEEGMDHNLYTISDDTSNLQKITWQHMGVGLGKYPYKSARVVLPIEGPVLTLEDVINEGTIDLSNNQWYRISPQNNSIDYKLFEEYPEIDHKVTRQVSDRLALQMPLVLLHDEQGTIGSTVEIKERYQQLVKEINEMKLKTPHDRDVRLANIVIAWNVFQHFYPYFDVVDVSWEDILLQTLSEAYEDTSKDEFLKTFNKMLAALEDGHGGVYTTNSSQWAQLPFIVDWIEEQLVVTVSKDEEMVLPGDIIVSINGMPAEEYLEEQEQYISGSPHNKRYVAMNNFVRGHQNSGSIQLEIKRDQLLFEITPLYIKSNTEIIDFFDRDYTIKEVEDDIYLVNLTTVQENDLNQYIKELEEAKGIIFDIRAYPDWQTAKKIISHIITEPVMSPKLNIPTIIYPDQEKKYHYDTSWEIAPQNPYFKGKIVFLQYHGTKRRPEVFTG